MHLDNTPNSQLTIPTLPPSFEDLCPKQQSISLPFHADTSSLINHSNSSSTISVTRKCHGPVSSDVNIASSSLNESYPDTEATEIPPGASCRSSSDTEMENQSYSKVVSAVSRACTLAAVTASQCIGKAHTKASDIMTTALTTIAYPVGYAWTSFRQTPIDIEELIYSEQCTVAILGKTYNISDIEERENFFLDCVSRVLFTYHKNFEPIVRNKKYFEDTAQQAALSSKPKSNLPFHERLICTNYDGHLISDAGWGCMIRASQMALCQALICARIGRNVPLYTFYLLSNSDKNILSKDSERCLEELHRILSLFHDSYSAPLSIHNITLYSEEHFNIPVGHWMGPTTCAQAMSYLMQCDRFSNYFKDIYPVVFSDGFIVHSKVREVWLDSCNRMALLIICMRLGTMNFNAERYESPLRQCFKLTQFQGIAGGGSWVSAHYFYGLCAQGLLFLDPHMNVQEIECEKLENVDDANLEKNSETRSSSLNSLDDTNSVQMYRYKLNQFILRHKPELNTETKLKKFFVVSWNDFNPSLAVYFLCKNSQDYEDLITHLKEISKNTPELFEMADCLFEYKEDLDVSSFSDDSNSVISDTKI